MSSSSRPTSPPTQAQLNLAALASPSPQQRTMRTLRRFQSHQVLSPSSSTDFQSQLAAGPSAEKHHPSSEDPVTQQQQQEQGQPRQLGSPAQFRTHRRPRSNSDAAAREAALAGVAPISRGSQTQRRRSRKTGSGIGVRKSMLENYLRDGPHDADLAGGLQELRYLVLSSRVEADSDGMVRSFEVVCAVRELIDDSRHIGCTYGSFFSISPLFQQMTTSRWFTVAAHLPTPRSATTPSAP